jgi:hypothetical protein
VDGGRDHDLSTVHRMAGYPLIRLDLSCWVRLTSRHITGSSDATEADDPSVSSEECHIVAQSTDNPWCESEMALERRGAFSNLILLCNFNHKVIDSRPQKCSPPNTAPGVNSSILFY